ncbi:MAG TPA: LacI family DNA-binding transcriptional regulator [Phycisphaerae bacterium]|nr:LacI family DNA-binding transcriptional regulator [Phycisphaerae bacterium]
MRVSIADVAKRANVSISTVSRVLNRRELVNEKTRERVEQAIRDLDYRPNVFARGLMLQRSEIVALVLPDVHGEFYSEIIRGANIQAREQGYHLVISSSEGPTDMGSLLEDLIGRSLVDGLAVMVSEQTKGLHRLLAKFRVPIVVLDSVVEDGVHDSVVIDQRAGALALCRHLVQARGAKRIIFVGGPTTNTDTTARLQACAEVLGEAGLRLSPDDTYHLDFQYDSAFVLAGERVKEWAGEGHFVFAANDEMACGVIDAATAAGLHVPQDLAVVGFDDTRIAAMTRPPLTTVRVPMSQMGSTAIELLCQRLADPQRSATCVSLRPELIVRESCGEGQRD